MDDKYDGHIDSVSIYDSELNTIFEPGNYSVLGYIKLGSREEWERAQSNNQFGGDIVDFFVVSWDNPRWMPNSLFRRLLWWRIWRFRRGLRKHLRLQRWEGHLSNSTVVVGPCPLDSEEINKIAREAGIE